MQNVVLDQPPAIGTYGRVLRRTDRDPRQAKQTRVPGYSYTARGLAVKHPDGEIGVTLFYPIGKETEAERQTRFGWVDVTAAWMKGLPLTRERVEAMEWLELRQCAVDLGLPASGKRPDLISRIIEQVEAAE